MTAAGAFFFVLVLFGLSELVRFHERELFLDVSDSELAEESLSSSWRGVRAIAHKDRIHLMAGGFATILFFLLTRKPRAGAALLVGVALISTGIFLAHFGVAWSEIQKLYSSTSPWPDSPAQMAVMPAAMAIFLGLVSLFILALAEALDREAASRQAGRLVESGEENSPEAFQRAKRHRQLVTVGACGAFRPWMAVARALPVAMLPAAFALILYDLADEGEGEMRAPPLSTLAPPARADAPRLTVMLNAEGTLVAGERTMLFGDDKAWNAAVEVFRKVRRLTGASARVELAVAPAVPWATNHRRPRRSETRRLPGNRDRRRRGLSSAFPQFGGESPCWTVVSPVKQATASS